MKNVITIISLFIIALTFSGCIIEDWLDEDYEREEENWDWYDDNPSFYEFDKYNDVCCVYCIPGYYPCGDMCISNNMMCYEPEIGCACFSY
jgi:hypothetical protein